eukprot:jgi/Bigna1/138783/aug1.46_g13491
MSKSRYSRSLEERRHQLIDRLVLGHGISREDENFAIAQEFCRVNLAPHNNRYRDPAIKRTKANVSALVERYKLRSETRRAETLRSLFAAFESVAASKSHGDRRLQDELYGIVEMIYMLAQNPLKQGVLNYDSAKSLDQTLQLPTVTVEAISEQYKLLLHKPQTQLVTWPELQERLDLRRRSKKRNEKKLESFNKKDEIEKQMILRDLAEWEADFMKCSEDDDDDMEEGGEEKDKEEKGGGEEVVEHDQANDTIPGSRRGGDHMSGNADSVELEREIATSTIDREAHHNMLPLATSLPWHDLQERLLSSQRQRILKGKRTHHHHDHDDHHYYHYKQQQQQHVMSESLLLNHMVAMLEGFPSETFIFRKKQTSRKEEEEKNTRTDATMKLEHSSSSSSSSSSSVFITNTNSNHNLFALSPKHRSVCVQHLSFGVLHSLIDEILSAANQRQALRIFARRYDHHPSRCMQAFATSVKNLVFTMDQALVDEARREGCASNDDKGSTHGDNNDYGEAADEGYRDNKKEEGDDKSNAALVAHLLSVLCREMDSNGLSSYASLFHVAAFLFRNTCTPYLQMIDEALRTGHITDPAGEFMLKQKNTSHDHNNTSRSTKFWSETLSFGGAVTVRAPSFLQNCATELLYTGRALRLIHTLRRGGRGRNDCYHYDNNNHYDNDDENGEDADDYHGDDYDYYDEDEDEEELQDHTDATSVSDTETKDHPSLLTSKHMAGNDSTANALITSLINRHLAKMVITEREKGASKNAKGREHYHQHSSLAPTSYSPGKADDNNNNNNNNNNNEHTLGSGNNNKIRKESEDGESGSLSEAEEAMALSSSSSSSHAMFFSSLPPTSPGYYLDTIRRPPSSSPPLSHHHSSSRTITSTAFYSSSASSSYHQLKECTTTLIPRSSLTAANGAIIPPITGPVAKSVTGRMRRMMMRRRALDESSMNRRPSHRRRQRTPPWKTRGGATTTTPASPNGDCDYYCDDDDDDHNEDDYNGRDEEDAGIDKKHGKATLQTPKKTMKEQKEDSAMVPLLPPPPPLFFSIENEISQLLTKLVLERHRTVGKLLAERLNGGGSRSRMATKARPLPSLSLNKFLIALRQFFLMGSGETAYRFQESLFPYLKDKRWPHERVLQDVLTDSLQVDPTCEAMLYGRIQVKPTIARPSKRVAGSCEALEWISGLTFRCDVPWPLSLVISDSAIAMYAEVFRLLLSTHFANWSLARVSMVATAAVKRPPSSYHREQRVGSISRAISGGRRKKQAEVVFFRSFYALRAKMSHIVGSIQSYMSGRAVRGVWPWFQQMLRGSLQETCELPSLMEAHNRYLAEMKSMMLLTKRSRPTLRKVKSLLAVCIQLQSIYSLFITSSPANEDDEDDDEEYGGGEDYRESKSQRLLRVPSRKKIVAKMTELQNVVDADVGFIIVVLKEVVAHGVQLNFNELILTLDFNRHFSSKKKIAFRQ